jgi:branched-chain amino acid transport system permease protein
MTERAVWFARRHTTGLTIAGVSALLAAVPLVVINPYQLGILNLIAVHAIVVLGLNLFIGYAGQISLGHAAFFGIGAYGSGVLTLGGLPPWLALPVTALGVAAAALLIGIPTLRLSGHYLAMATLGFNIVVHHVLVQWDPVTGGPSGLSGIPPFALPGFVFAGERQQFYLLWGATMIGLTLALNLVRSGVGRGLAALAEDETAAAALGIDVRRGKIAVFTVSAVFASVAGSLFAHYMGTITPDTFGIFASIDFVIMVVIGGLGSLWGSVGGAAFVTLLPTVLGTLEAWRDIIHGLIVVVVLTLLPRGLLPGAVELVRRATSREPRAAKLTV